MQLAKFNQYIQGLGRVAVAFSGGVDSALLARLAAKVLTPENVLLLTAVSPSFSRSERESLTRAAADLGLTHISVPTDELEDPEYCRNDRLRCYYCKRRLFQTLRECASEHGFDVALEGSNLDDARRYRPGRRALEELGVPSPLEMFGFRKADIRDLARAEGLVVAEKPSIPCLASRVMYGIPLSAELFAQIDAAEDHVREMLQPADNFRVRVHADGLARLELSRCDLPRVLGDIETLDALSARLHGLGFRFVTVDVDGFRIGSLDGGL